MSDLLKAQECEQNERKERIIKAAFKMFCEHGVEQTNLKQIARYAQVGDMTLYRYFGSKPNLVLSALHMLWDEIDHGIKEQVTATEYYELMTGLEQLRVQLDCLRNLYLRHADFVRFSFEAKIYLIRHNSKLPIYVFDRMMTDVRDPCISAIDKGRRDGSIPVEEDSEDLFYAIWGSIRGYIIKIVLYDLLCDTQSPWESRYPVLERGILSALQHGWK